MHSTRIEPWWPGAKRTLWSVSNAYQGILGEVHRVPMNGRGKLPGGMNVNGTMSGAMMVYWMCSRIKMFLGCCSCTKPVGIQASPISLMPKSWCVTIWTTLSLARILGREALERRDALLFRLLLLLRLTM